MFKSRTPAIMSRAGVRRLSVAGVVAAGVFGLAACQGQAAALQSADAGAGQSTSKPAPAATDGGSGVRAPAGVTASALPATNPAAGPAGPTECAGSQIQVTLGHYGAASGNESYVLLFTNVSQSSCYLSGYPGAELPGFGGNPSSNAARTMTGYSGGAYGYTSPPTVILAKGTTASARVEWEMYASDAQPTVATCPGMGDTGLVVTVPNTQASTTFKIGVDAGMCAKLQIHPVVPGTAGTTQQNQ